MRVGVKSELELDDEKRSFGRCERKTRGMCQPYVF